MIKQSLAQLRNKLDSMKRDKEAVEMGIQGYESKYRGPDHAQWEELQKSTDDHPNVNYTTP